MSAQEPDLPEIPSWIIAVADIRGPWRLRARIVLTVLRYCLRVLNPWGQGGKLFIVRGDAGRMNA